MFPSVTETWVVAYANLTGIAEIVAIISGAYPSKLIAVGVERRDIPDKLVVRTVGDDGFDMITRDRITRFKPDSRHLFKSLVG